MGPAVANRFSKRDSAPRGCAVHGHAVISEFRSGVGVLPNPIDIQPTASTDFAETSLLLVRSTVSLPVNRELGSSLPTNSRQFPIQSSGP